MKYLIGFKHKTSSDPKVEDCICWWRNLKPRNETPRGQKDWLQREATSKGKTPPLCFSKSSQLLQDTRIHQHIAQEEPKLQRLLHRIAPENRGGRRTLCRNKISTNFQTLGSPCCNWWSSWLSLLSLWLNRQTGWSVVPQNFLYSTASKDRSFSIPSVSFSYL